MKRNTLKSCYSCLSIRRCKFLHLLKEEITDFEVPLRSSCHPWCKKDRRTVGWIHPFENVKVTVVGSIGEAVWIPRPVICLRLRDLWTSFNEHTSWHRHLYVAIWSNRIAHQDRPLAMWAIFEVILTWFKRVCTVDVPELVVSCGLPWANVWCSCVHLKLQNFAQQDQAL